MCVNYQYVTRHSPAELMCNYAFTCVYVWNSQWSLLRLQFPQKVSLACVLLILFYSCSCYRTLAFDMNIRELLYHFSCFYFKFKVLKWLNSINPSIIHFLPLICVWVAGAAVWAEKSDLSGDLLQRRFNLSSNTGSAPGHLPSRISL